MSWWISSNRLWVGKMLKIAVYGIGNFGFALLRHLSKKSDDRNFALYAYDRDINLMNHLKSKREHLKHHKGIKISDSVIYATNIQELINNTDILVIAVTSDAIKQIISDLKPYINKDLIILNTAKALDVRTGARLSKVISDGLKDINHSFSVAMLAGGTIAHDLFNHEPLGVDIASEDEKTLKVLRDIFTSDNLNVYTTTDLKGVEYAAAFKNVIAILAGVISGLGFSYGSETHMISRAAGEVKKLVVTKFGAEESTFSIESQCWGNDLWMSCTGNSRNREFGILLGKGYRTEEALQKMKKKNKTIEGINTSRVIKKLIGNNENAFPILYNTHEIVFEGKDPMETITYLMHSNRI